MDPKNNYRNKVLMQIRLKERNRTKNSSKHQNKMNFWTIWTLQKRVKKNMQSKDREWLMYK